MAGNLNGFDFKVVPIKGPTNLIADGVSRSITMAHNIGGRKKGPVFGPWHFPDFLKISKGPNSTQKSIESRLGYMMG